MLGLMRTGVCRGFRVVGVQGKVLVLLEGILDLAIFGAVIHGRLYIHSFMGCCMHGLMLQ